MTTAGWVFMIGSIGFVVSLAGYCYYRVLVKPEAADHLQAPQTIDTQDLED
jgi:hypothetical protein